jgi:metal-dependent amidase/aminoacylase/carboxypeptidase family protein
MHFGNHNYPGKIYLSKGPVTALSRRIRIKIKGKNCHCMTPYNGIDANYIGCLIVPQLYSLISMNLPPF